MKCSRILSLNGCRPARLACLRPIKHHGATNQVALTFNSPACLAAQTIRLAEYTGPGHADFDFSSLSKR